MWKRCNGVADCDSNFDEINCNLILIDERLYQKVYPPNEVDGSETKVNVSLSIVSIGNFQELDMTFGVKFLIQLKWYAV